MKNILIIALIGVAFACSKTKPTNIKAEVKPGPITLVIHGGAGTIKRENMTPESFAALKNVVLDPLDAPDTFVWSPVQHPITLLPL